MRPRIVAIAVAALLTIAVTAVGFSALGQARDTTMASAASVEESAQSSDNAAVSTFKYVCPFH